MKEFFKGFTNCFSAFHFILKNGMARFYIWLFFGSVVLAIFSVYWLYGFSGWLSDVFFQKMGDLLNLPLEKQDSGWVLKSTGLILGFVIRVFSIYIFLKFSKYIYLILFSPLFAFVSEITEEKITGKKFPFSISKIFRDAVRGILVSVRNLSIELVASFLVFIVSIFIPFLSIPLGFGLLLLSFYYFGYAMIDYNHERWGMTIKDGITRVKQHKFRALGIGAFYYTATLIPFVGWIFAGINGAVGAVLSESELVSN